MRGHQAVASCPADLETLRPGAVDQELQTAGALAQHGAKRALHLIRAQAEYAGRGSGGTERAAGRGGVEAAVVVLAGGERECHAAGDLIAGDDGRQHIGARRAGHLASGQCRGDYGRARMQRAGGMCVVEIQRMRQRTVEERRTGGRVARGVTEHAGIAGGHAHGADRGKEGRRALRVVACADDVADQVEHQEAGALHHLGRQTVEADVGGELSEVSGNAHGGCIPPVRAHSGSKP